MGKQGWILCLRYQNDKGFWNEDTLLASAKIGNKFLNYGLKICFWHRVCGDHRRCHPWRTTLQFLNWHWWDRPLVAVWAAQDNQECWDPRSLCAGLRTLPQLVPCKQLWFISWYNARLHKHSCFAVKQKEVWRSLGIKTPWSWKPFISSQ